MAYKTQQEEFWAGSFGDEYIQRNLGDSLLASNLSFFSKALQQTRDISSCIEFGANIGMNLKAINLLKPGCDLSAIEINNNAAEILCNFLPKESVYNCSIMDFKPKQKWDFTLVKGVLIHINPELLPEVYDKLEECCDRYLLIAEYYNPSPVTISYRGHSDKLFKRDFAGEMMDRHPQFQLLDYGFSYHRDPNFPSDDITWFLMEKI